MTSLKSALVVFLLLGLGEGLNIGDCPEKLPRDKSLYFYDNVCYQIVNKKQSFWDAEGDCEREGGTLVIIKSKNVNDLILEQLREHYIWDFGVWIGLHDEETEGSFQWQDGTRLLEGDYSNWGYQEGKKLDPDDTYHPDFDEDCVQLSPFTGKWYDRECKDWNSGKDIKAPYVCQYTVKDKLPTSNPSKKPSILSTTLIPTTPVPTTPVPTTPVPTTPVPTTPVPTTPVPTTPVPTTPVPTTPVPTTPVPTTPVPTTPVPTTPVATTPVPTTPVPTTPVPTTPVPTTPVPTTVPTTSVPSTRAPTTIILTSLLPKISTPEIQETSVGPPQTTPEPTCPPFVCTLDCGMDGYRMSERGCSLCQCDSDE